MKSNQNGFGALPFLLILVIIGIIGFTGWYVWHSRHGSTPSSPNPPAATSSAKTSTKPVTTLKDYTNTDVGLGFKYPSDWTVKENLSDPRDLGMEGTITMQSPTGLILAINPNFGGKGGSCQEDPTDTPHNTKNCSTIEILHKEKVALTSSDTENPDVYLFEVKYTAARTGSTPPPSRYVVYLSNNKQEINAEEPLIGAWFDLGIVDGVNGRNIDTAINGVDLSSPDVLKSAEVKQAEDILRSLHVLQ